MAYKLGLKLWSINTDYYYEEAKKLYSEGIFDYIELYVVPNSTETIPKWQELGVPFTLHAPHFLHDINLAMPEYYNRNKDIYKQVNQFAEKLNAKYIVIHGGISGTVSEVIRQFNALKTNINSILLIENKPYKAPIGEKRFCRGATIEEISKIIKETGCGFCLDIGHAICSANYLGIEPYDYIKKYDELNPVCYHFSDNNIDSTVDKHEHFGNGNFNFEKILNIINSEKNIAIETKKDSKTNLNDFVEDCNFIRRFKCK